MAEGAMTRWPVGRAGWIAVAALAALAGVAPAGRAAGPAPAGGRAIAITFDDLPATRSGSLADMQAITRRLLAHFRTQAIQVTGFVNEGKLAVPGEEAARTALLEAWLDAGHDLGNHTYSHRRLYDTPLPEFEEEVLRGERITRRLLVERGRTPRYFRHPTLNTGPDAATKAAFEAFLAAHGYAVAPVTIDSDEYLHAAAYDRARARGSRATMKRIGRDYLRYMRDVFGFHERLSLRLFGREPAQVLLLHANALNAEYFDDLLALMRARGYRVVTLDHALSDDVYRSPDAYVGDRGLSWLQRWAITRGENPGLQPEVPEWVRTMARG
jgi:peptidoglycan/xylan/chitin deacetylase (PgdA/CDA1 family)